MHVCRSESLKNFPTPHHTVIGSFCKQIHAGYLEEFILSAAPISVGEMAHQTHKIALVTVSDRGVMVFVAISGCQNWPDVSTEF